MRTWKVMRAGVAGITLGSAAIVIAFGWKVAVISFALSLTVYVVLSAAVIHEAEEREDE